MMFRRCRPVPAVSSSGFKGFRYPPDVIVLAVRWYLRYGLSYRDVEELLVERGIEVEHVTVFRWVQRFTRHCCVGRKQDNSLPRRGVDQVCESGKLICFGRNDSSNSDLGLAGGVWRSLNATVPL